MSRLQARFLLNHAVVEVVLEAAEPPNERRKPVEPDQTADHARCRVRVAWRFYLMHVRLVPRD